MLLAAAVAVVIYSCNQIKEKNETSEATANGANETVSQHQHPAIGKNILAGNWIRTDGGYRIEITELLDDGKMEVGYFNPKPINVAEARWTIQDEMMKINLELRDENYPGSRYNLTHIPGRDILVGDYYQAMEGSTYKVEFKRTK